MWLLRRVSCNRLFEKYFTVASQQGCNRRFTLASKSEKLIGLNPASAVIYGSLATRSRGQVLIVRGFFFKNKHVTTVAKRDDAFQIESDKQRDKKLYREVIARFKAGNPNYKGHVEFILAALKHLKEFQVHEDLNTYKELMDLFPKKKMIAPTLIAAEFWHFPRHQDTAITLLDCMESNGVMPDREMRQLVMDIFGTESHVFRKLCRQLYWVPKFKHASPYPLPKPVPRDPRLLAWLAIKRITSIDPMTEVTEMNTEDVLESLDKTWIISGQSLKQRELLLEEGEQPIWIEGPRLIWLREAVINYFILAGEARQKPEVSINTNDTSNLKLTMFGEKDVEKHDLSLLPCVHEQKDLTIFAVCATGTCSRDSLLSWLRLLQKTNPYLEKLTVVFKLTSPPPGALRVEAGSTHDSSQTSKHHKNDGSETSGDQVSIQERSTETSGSEK